MKKEEEAAKIAEIFTGLGAEKNQALVMAKQLLKRSEQLAKEKKSTQVEELKKLLEVAVLGAQGLVKPPDDPESR